MDVYPTIAREPTKLWDHRDGLRQLSVPELQLRNVDTELQDVSGVREKDDRAETRPNLHLKKFFEIIIQCLSPSCLTTSVKLAQTKVKW